MSCFLKGLNQYKAEDKMSCPRTQLSAFGESQTSDSSNSSLTQNMCLHGALCFISINLICNMTTFRKEKKMTFCN